MTLDYLLGGGNCFVTSDNDYGAKHVFRESMKHGKLGEVACSDCGSVEWILFDWLRDMRLRCYGCYCKAVSEKWSVALVSIDRGM